MMTKNPIYRLENVWKRFRSMEKGRGDLEVLKGINLDIPQGFSAILGPSGEGKSTLMNILATLDEPSDGAVYLDGQRIPYGGNGALRAFRRQVSLVFQDHNLISHMTAAENVAFPLICRGVGRAEALSEAERYLSALGLQNHLRHRPGKLSGGQKQRVGIARAFASQASVILADEPTGNLDRESAGCVMEAFRELSEHTDTPVIIVTHNEEMAAQYCDRRWELRDGQLHGLHGGIAPLQPAHVRTTASIYEMQTA